jgi:hypothetical protein
VQVLIGAGGTGGASNGATGNGGGNTSFGDKLFTYGGGGGGGNATVAGYQGGGYGGGAFSLGTTTSGPRLSNAVSGSIMTVQINGGGAGGGQFTSGATTLNQLDGSSSMFGGGGGAGAQTAAVASGGGSSAFGGSGGGAGGRSTTGGSATTQFGSRGGNPYPTTTANSSEFFGASGGGQPQIYGLASPPAAGFLEGGGGGVPAQPTLSAQSIQAAVNGSQVVILALASGTAGFASSNPAVLLVSSDGLANYTPYSIGRYSTPAASGIVYDGSKYVISTLVSGTSAVGGRTSYYRSIISTTDFTTFTEYPLSGIPAASISQTSNDNPLNYINSIYFLNLSDDLYYSTNLTSWTRANVAGGTSVGITGLAFDGTYYYAISSSNLYRSTNLISWTAFSYGGSGGQSIAVSATTIVVSCSASVSRYSTDQGATWSNLPTIAVSAGQRVRYFSATGDWLMITNTGAMYYTTAPATSWTLSTVASVGGPIVYNGTRYVLGSASSSTVAANTSTTAAGTFATQAFTALPTAATPGSPGGIAGGGGGGAASSTTTTNGGNGGNGYCRVYSW